MQKRGHRSNPPLPISIPYAPRFEGLTLSTPVLFLDFDGVLHPYDVYAVDANVRAERFCWLPLLTQTLAPHPAVRIVVTSDWRYFSDADRMRELLGPLSSRFAGCTAFSRGFTRADHILQVVQQEALQHWRALDDDASVFKAAREEPRFVACDPATGLSEPLVIAALERWLLQLR